MPSLNVVTSLVIGMGLVFLGLLTWKQPLWLHKMQYKWVAFAGRKFMRTRHHEDMKLLFDDPVKWTAQHRFTIVWTRITIGCGAFVLGLLIIGLSLAVWAAG